MATVRKLKEGEAKAAPVRLLPLKLASFAVTVRGTSPLVCHRFSQKVAQEMLEKQQKRARQGRPIRDPQREFLDSLYVMPGSVAGEDKARYGIPASHFTLAMIGAARWSDLKMTRIRGTFRVLPDSGDLVELKYDKLSMRQDAVTVNKGMSRDLRFRGQFDGWSCKLKIMYNSSAITPEIIVNLLQVAGFSGGIGEMRPSQGCSGNYGCFEVVA